MSKYVKFAYAPALVALLTLAACGDKKDDTLAADSMLNRDMQLAGADTAVQPALQDQPPAATPAPAPAAPAPAPAPRPRPTPRPTTTASGNTVTPTRRAETSLGTIAAGTTLNLASSSRVCTNTHKVGDRVTATTTSSVSGSNGAVIPAGATVSLEITELKRSENANDNIAMGFAVRSISFNDRSYPVSATVASAQVDRVRSTTKGKDAQKVATGAAVGAILGQVIGKNTKGTVIGGAIGAAAGAAGAAATGNYDGCVPSGGNITITLSNGVQVHT